MHKGIIIIATIRLKKKKLRNRSNKRVERIGI